MTSEFRYYIVNTEAHIVCCTNDIYMTIEFRADDKYVIIDTWDMDHTNKAGGWTAIVELGESR